MTFRIWFMFATALALFGCVDTGFNAVDVAKQSTQVQSFLAAHPGSTISVVLLSTETAQTTLAQYPACASIAPQRMYFVTFQDQSQSAIAFVNASSQTLLCAVVNNSTVTPSVSTSPSVIPSPQPQGTSLCPGGAYYCPQGSACSTSATGGFECTAPDASWVTCGPGRVCPAGDACRPYLSMRPCGPGIACPLYLCVPTPSIQPTPTLPPNEYYCPDGYTICQTGQICTRRPFPICEECVDTMLHRCPCFDYTCSPNGSPSASPSPTLPPVWSQNQNLESCFPAPAAGASGTVSNTMTANTPIRFRPSVDALTVAAQMGAVCSQGRLSDPSGKPILFYQPPCFGIEPPPGTMEAIAATLKQLQQQYAVITVELQYACE